MKKLLFILATMTLSAQAAHAYICQVDLIDNRGILRRTFTAQSDFNGTCRDALRDCNREMRTSGIQGRCETRNTPGPGPTPNPYPYPNPNPGYGTTVGVILSVASNSSSRMIVLEGYGNSDLYSQCMQQVPNGPSIDEITVVANNSSVRRSVNSSSYWNRTADICNIVMSNISVSSNYNMPIDIYGSVENRQLSIRAMTKVDAFIQCHSQVANMGSVDDISLSINNSPMRALRNQSAYWKNASQVCNVIMQQIDLYVR